MNLNNIQVIKLGGALIENTDALSGFISGIASYLKHGTRPIVIVHGGGCLVDNLLKGLGLKSEKKNGLRVTPFNQIGYITGALAGTANKLMLCEATKQGINAVGLCLGDGGIVTVKQKSEDLGAVGEAFAGNPALLENLLSAGYIPLISSIGIDNRGRLMNVNADQAALAIALVLKADLALLSDVEGILDQNKHLIKEMTADYAEKLINEGVISGGMTVKVHAAIAAATALNRPLSVGSWRDPAKVEELLSGKIIGTKVLPV